MKSGEEEELTWSAGGEAFLFSGSSSFFCSPGLLSDSGDGGVMDDRPKLCFGSLVCSCVVLLFFLCFGFFLAGSRFFSPLFFSPVSGFSSGFSSCFFFSFSVQFPQFFFFVCVSAQSSPFKTKTNGGKSTRICCWLSDQKFPWVMSLFVPSFVFCFSPSVLFFCFVVYRDESNGKSNTPLYVVFVWFVLSLGFFCSVFLGFLFFSAPSLFFGRSQFFFFLLCWLRLPLLL